MSHVQVSSLETVPVHSFPFDYDDGTDETTDSLSGVTSLDLGSPILPPSPSQQTLFGLAVGGASAVLRSVAQTSYWSVAAIERHDRPVGSSREPSDSTHRALALFYDHWPLLDRLRSSLWIPACLQLANISKEWQRAMLTIDNGCLIALVDSGLIRLGVPIRRFEESGLQGTVVLTVSDCSVNVIARDDIVALCGAVH
jgi:hypothetical protein